MHRRTWTTLALAIAVLLATGAFAGAALAKNTTVGKPALSKAPHMGVAFAVSGVTTPAAKTGVKVVVQIQLLMRDDTTGMYMPMHAAYKAKLVKRSGMPGYRFSQSLTIPMMGKHAVQALRYDDGKLVGKSKIRYFTVG
jgi:hypothetical protein